MIRARKARQYPAREVFINNTKTLAARNVQGLQKMENLKELL